MFVRKKKNRSGSTSVVVSDKSGGVFTELKVVGVGTTEEEIHRLVVQGKDGFPITAVSRRYPFRMSMRNNSDVMRMQ